MNNQSAAISPRPATNKPCPASTRDPAESLLRLAEAEEVDEPSALAAFEAD